MENVSVICKNSLTQTTPSCVLTVNQRLSVELRRQSPPANRKAQIRAQILPLSTWIKEQWLQHASDNLLLDQWQEYCLWHDIISNHISGGIINVTQTAKLAQQAWKLINHWLTNTQEWGQHNNLDIASFHKWTKEFQLTCLSQKLISESQLPLAVINMIETGHINNLPTDVTIVGFDEFSPVITKLISTLQAHCDVHIATNHPKQAPVEIASFTTPDDELSAALNWGINNATQNKSIAIVIPDLTDKHHTIRRLLKKTPSEYYNLSAGRKLIEYEIIQVAIAIIRLLTGFIKTQDAYLWLQSPYLAMNDHEIDVGAILDSQLRQLEENTVPVSIIFNLIRKIKNIKNTSWINRLRNFSKVISTLKKNDSPQNIATSWCECLNTIGWPGGRELSSLEHQLIEKFKSVIDAFSKLADVKSTMNDKEALALLELQCRDTAFQPEGSEAPLQILGFLECSGMKFEKIWVTSLDSEALPSPVKLNPFIPASVQQASNMPHSTAEKERLFANQLLQRLLNSAEESCISWAQTKEDKAMKPSTLISNLTCFSEKNTTLNEKAINHFYCAENIEKSDLFDAMEEIEDNIAPPPSKEERTRGGSRLLELQANCPFRAFAEMRLKALPLASPSMGMSAADRGALTHRILEDIWNTLNSQQQLMMLPDEQLSELIETSIDNNLTIWKKGKKLPQDNTWPRLEKMRLNTILHDWLTKEKSRAPFTVLGHEIEQSIKIDTLTLNIKLDRVDQVSPGQYIIIDYKTGASSISHWFGERPTAPQLPLYCSYGQIPGSIEGISFAFIKPFHTEFAGVGSERLEAGIPNIRTTSSLKISGNTSWSECIQNWQQSLTQLSHEFCSGISHVSPHSSSSCQYCELQSFCRINQ